MPDAVTQAQIIRLLEKLQRETGVSYLIIPGTGRDVLPLNLPAAVGEAGIFGRNP